jgi:hypothetical protein
MGRIAMSTHALTDHATVRARIPERKATTWRGEHSAPKHDGYSRGVPTAGGRLTSPQITPPQRGNEGRRVSASASPISRSFAEPATRDAGPRAATGPNSPRTSRIDQPDVRRAEVVPILLRALPCELDHRSRAKRGATARSDCGLVNPTATCGGETIDDAPALGLMPFPHHARGLAVDAGAWRRRGHAASLQIRASSRSSEPHGGPPPSTTTSPARSQGQSRTNSETNIPRGGYPEAQLRQQFQRRVDAAIRVVEADSGRVLDIVNHAKFLIARRARAASRAA